jgi:hypothetical protein
MLNETETSDPTLSSPPPSYSPNATSDESPSGNGIFKTINKHKYEGIKNNILLWHPYNVFNIFCCIALERFRFIVNQPMKM